jgi:protein-serine/threonine kinase
MKAISKRSVLTFDELPHTLAELSILRRMAVYEPDNQFISRLHYAFTDRENFYFVMEFYPGGDLATQMEIYGRFYAVDVTEGLEDLYVPSRSVSSFSSSESISR